MLIIAIILIVLGIGGIIGGTILIINDAEFFAYIPLMGGIFAVAIGIVLILADCGLLF